MELHTDCCWPEKSVAACLRADADGDTVHQSTAGCQAWNADLAKLLLQCGPEMTKGRFMAIISTWSPVEPNASWGLLGELLLALKRGEKVRDRDKTLVTGVCQIHPANNFPAPSTRSPFRQISICARNDPAGPHRQSRSGPLIKMKWAADPMMPFRRVEHCLWDLYLTDQQVQNEKKSTFPLRRFFCPSLLPFRAYLYLKKKEEKEEISLCGLTTRTKVKIKSKGTMLSAEQKKKQNWGLTGV